MDHTEFKEYLSRLEELSPAQKRKLSHVFRIKDEGEEVVETLEKRFSGDEYCPHCKHNQFQKWGRSHGMQRYRCKSCRKTFNAATGTPLAHLRKKEKWLEYSKAMVDGLSIRKAARKCGIDTTTSFRWRHRFLRGLRDKKDSSLKGIVEGRRDLLPGVVQRFAEPGAQSPQKGRQGHEAGVVGRANPGSDRKGSPRRDDGRSAERPQRSLDHQSAQACLGTGCGPLHGRKQILSGIREHRESRACPADRLQ